MLRNLLENALKYSPQDKPVSFSSSISQDQVIFKISDSGIGIPETEQASVFDKYYRASNTTDIAGAGVGLHLVSKIVNQHGGNLSLSSTKGDGSTFTISLPLST
jgi:signal transduction histidine kinase